MRAAVADKEDGVKELCTVVFLAMNSWLDIRRREISLLLTVVYAGCGIICSILQGRKIQDVLIPAGIGILFLAAGLISRGAIGAGDCWILLALGALLDTETYIRMLCIGFFLAAFWSGILLVIRRKSRKTEIPLVPFLLAGYIGGILI
ncbi:MULTISPECIES: prepilin peptidase [Blautia]|jgi:leader peptidase (prepilin peptidase)/N-methyltransferase|uniref:Prepilin peptidase n=1 Tax=Blautia intestinihominis TaxID=3133152 RepID=A0ABV1AIA6_9FIRM|nr:prepilin peptidase [Blautia sp. OM07-19]MBP8795690.1 prepilin peptidase [Lachnospiraceae bacterium]RHV02177.1 prepilin peptidase [Blautia sp. OM07-19]